MALRTNKLAAASAVAAAFSMLAAPAGAVDLPKPAAVEAYDGDALNAERHRRWRDNDIDGGDILAGVLIIGGIAAIASAAAKNKRERETYRYPSPPPPEPDTRYRTPGYDGAYGSRGIDRAVDLCVYEVERRADRVGSVDRATRSSDGWHISGELGNGAPYSCAIDNNGEISDLFIGDNGVAYDVPQDGQYDDDYYADARARQQPAPSYPDADGVADDVSDEQYDDDYYTTARAAQTPSYPSDDGRYEVSRTPDFEQ